MYGPNPLRISKLREDIRNEIAREQGDQSGGPDFFGPFWRSAKDHVFGISDLHNQVEIHIGNNPRRANLYPQLRDGFLLWWNERRRWTNLPFSESNAIKGILQIGALGTEIKIDSVMSVRDGHGDDHFIYPYFSEVPALPDEAARIALWVLQNAFPDTPSDELRVLDVIRGNNFSLEAVPLQGNEEDILIHRYRHLLEQWNDLREEYD